MNPTRRDLTRLVTLGAAAVVLGIPLALIAVSREPLEPVPRGGRASAGEEEPASDGEAEQGADEQDGRSRGRRGRRSRGSDDGAAEAGTPVP
jgi:hypothetical protein